MTKVGKTLQNVEDIFEENYKILLKNLIKKNKINSIHGRCKFNQN